MKVYEKIEIVLKSVSRPLAPHEFNDVYVQDLEQMLNPTGRQFVGCSEATLGRRLREMRELGIVTAKRREGKAFVEYALVPKEAAVPA